MSMWRIRMRRSRILKPLRIVEAPGPVIQYVGFGGTIRSVTTDMKLGRGVWRTPEYGLRRAVWDAAHGYVSGFRIRDIAYYLVTRSFSERIAERVIAWEQSKETR